MRPIPRLLLLAGALALARWAYQIVGRGSRGQPVPAPAELPETEREPAPPESPRPGITFRSVARVD